MKIIDVHAHMESSRFDGELSEILEIAKKAGVNFIINSGVNPKTNRKTLELSKRYPIIKCSFGLYPVDSIVEMVGQVGDDDGRVVKSFSVEDEIKWIEEHAGDCVAIGEVGLDYQVAPDYKDEQKVVFLKAIDLAKKLDKPIVIHSRKAEADAIEILKESGIRKVVMHCFSGKKALIREGVEAGFYFSVPPVIERLQHFETLVGLVPIEQLLTETDAPYLSPVAGKRNDPSNILITLKKIAEIKGLNEKEVAEQIFKNAQKVFNL